LPSVRAGLAFSGEADPPRSLKGKLASSCFIFVTLLTL
jgi:hypothetical protein